MAGATAVAAVLTVASVGSLRLDPVPEADFGIGLTALAWSPEASRQGAIAALGAVLLGLVVAVLAVAAMTVLALSAARASARRLEIVVRRSMGASRWQLRSAGLVEGGMIAAAAIAVGAPVGVAGAKWAIATWPGGAGLASIGIPAAALLGLVAVMLLGALFPMLSLPRTPRIVTRGAIPHGFVVPIVQFGISLSILVAAAQLTRRADGLIGDTRAVERTSGQIYQVREGARPEERAARYTSLLRQIGDGTFDVVSLTSPGASVGLGTVDFVITDCGHCTQGGIATPLRIVPVTLSAISRDTFRAIGVRTVRGRSIGDSDSWSSTRVAVVNEALARAHFEQGVAVGRKVLVGRGPGSAWFTVVGVVEDRKAVAFGGALQPPSALYVSALQLPPSAAELLLRPGIAGRPLQHAEQALQRALGRSGTVVRRVAEAERLREEAAPIQWFSRLVRLEGVIVLALSVCGMFAVMLLWVNALQPELAVRRAVGAQRRHVLGYALARALVVALIGVAVGLWITQMTVGMLESAVIGPSALALLAATLAGALGPAWRAARAAPAAGTAALEGAGF